MASFRMRNANATLSFQANGVTHTAYVRVSHTSYKYGVNSTESHSRTHRAFYPHRRALGRFAVTVDAIGYREFRNFMNWLRIYTEALLSSQVGNAKGAKTMTVQVPSRNFHKVGILTAGIDDHDHVGSMVFSPVLQFQMIKDFNDPGTAIVKVNSVSRFHAPKVNPDTSQAFFPVTVSSYRDTDSAIYDLGDDTVNPPDTGSSNGGIVMPPGQFGHQL